LITLEPITRVYEVPFDVFQYGFVMHHNRLFNLTYWNPILFLLSVFVLAFGTWRRWLTGLEIVVGAGLLSIPYVTRAYDMSMASHGRFAAVVIANYIVVGKILTSLPSPIAAVATCGSAVLLTLWSALFLAGFLFF
jgi:hypothetical protein